MRRAFSIAMTAWPHFLAIDRDYAEQDVISDQRHPDRGACTKKLNHGDSPGITRPVGFFRRDISDVDNPLATGDSSHRSVRTRSQWSASDKIREGR
jgi:hypothetical protein